MRMNDVLRRKYLCPSLNFLLEINKVAFSLLLTERERDNTRLSALCLPTEKLFVNSYVMLFKI